MRWGVKDRLAAGGVTLLLVAGCTASGAVMSASQVPGSPPGGAATSEAPSPTVSPPAARRTPPSTPSPSTAEPVAAPAGGVVVTYRDPNQVELVSPGGQRVLVDVWSPDAVTRPATAQDILLTTHSHDDHYVASFVDAFPGQKLTVESGRLVAGDVTVTGIAAAHNDGDPLLPKGGTDYIFVIDLGGFRVVHFGDLGQRDLTKAQMAVIGKVDLAISQLANSVSGTDLSNRIDFRQMAQVQPRVLIPTHLGEDAAATLKAAAATWPTAYTTARTITLVRSALPASTNVLVMGDLAASYGKLAHLQPAAYLSVP